MNSPPVSVITLAVADLDRSRAFYGAGLGWEPALDLAEIVFYRAGHGLLLGLMAARGFAEEHGLDEATTATTGLSLSHNLASPDQVDAFVTLAVAAGATLMKRPQRAAFGGYHAYFSDPDGHRWEVAFNPGLTVAADGTVTLVELTYCTRCDYGYEELPAQDIAPSLRSLSLDHAELLSAIDVDRQRVRPALEVWSALEYGCHVRDVLLVQRSRVLRALTEDTPVYSPMNRDGRAVIERYNEQDPLVVAVDLVANADALAETLESLEQVEWEREGVYNYPTSRLRSITWIGRNTVHELIHHLHDMRAGLSATEAT